MKSVRESKKERDCTLQLLIVHQGHGGYQGVPVPQAGWLNQADTELVASQRGSDCPGQPGSYLWEGDMSMTKGWHLSDGQGHCAMMKSLTFIFSEKCLRFGVEPVNVHTKPVCIHFFDILVSHKKKYWYEFFTFQTKRYWDEKMAFYFCKVYFLSLWCEVNDRWSSSPGT